MNHDLGHYHHYYYYYRTLCRLRLFSLPKSHNASDCVPFLPKKPRVRRVNLKLLKEKYDLLNDLVE